MRLRVIVSPTLTLNKEDKVIPYGEEFEVSEARGIEILKTTFNGSPVAEFVSSNGGNSNEESLIKEKETLEEKVKELEEANKNLTTEKGTLEEKVKELEEANKNLTPEKGTLEEKVKELEKTNEKNEINKGKGDNK